MKRLSLLPWLWVGLMSLLGSVPGAQANETVTLVMTDAQGTPVVETDIHGTVLARYAYRPYGTAVGGPLPAGPGYTGHVNDPDTGLVYMQQRYYDPEVGRFQSVDPVGPVPGNVFNLGRYAYAYNNPVRYIDPDGRCPWCAVVGAVTGAVIGASTAYVSSGGNWRTTFAGGVGGAVGGAITGLTVGAGSELAITVAAGITSGIAGEGTTETVQNAMAHGTDIKSYQYSLGKIAVAGILGAVGTANAKLAEQFALSAAKRVVLANSVVVPAQLVSDQIADHPSSLPVIHLPVVERPEPDESNDPRPDQSILVKDHLELH